MDAMAVNGGDGFALLRKRERGRRGRERVERSRGPGGLRGNARGVQALGVKQEVARRVASRAGHAPVLLARRKTTGEGPGGLGRAGGLASWAATGKSGKFSLSPLFSVFYYFCNFRALLKIPERFQKSWK